MNTFEEIIAVVNQYQRFVILSHIRPDGDAIGSTIALGSTLEEMGKDVTYINEDGVPESLVFLPGSDKVQKPTDEVLDIEVAIAVDCANKPRLGENALKMAANAKLWINIDHHKSNPGYGDLNYIDSNSPATGQILYQMITEQELTLTDEARDSIYVAVSTDTGSFQYSGTTAATYEMAADLVTRGLNTGKINEQIYDSFPYRRVALTRELLNTLEISSNGEIADWQLLKKVKHDHDLQPDDSEGLIDMIRSIQGVKVALFFEELMDDSIRVSIRSKIGSIDACEMAQVFGGGGHAKAAGIRMPGPISEARRAVISEVTKHLS
ncbi:MAG: phosphoesterase RecJ-like protein [Cryomorphaceae bacterium]|jgi:phosphoesterase RecJ-like protein